MQSGPPPAFLPGGDRELLEKKITVTPFRSVAAAEERAKEVRAQGDHANVGRMLTVGDLVNIEGLDYRVQDVRSRGRVFLKLLGEMKR